LASLSSYTARCETSAGGFPSAATSPEPPHSPATNATQMSRWKGPAHLDISIILQLWPATHDTYKPPPPQINGRRACVTPVVRTRVWPGQGGVAGSPERGGRNGWNRR